VREDAQGDRSISVPELATDVGDEQPPPQTQFGPQLARHVDSPLLMVFRGGELGPHQVRPDEQHGLALVHVARLEGQKLAGPHPARRAQSMAFKFRQPRPL
jgi:hypothetical protein